MDKQEIIEGSISDSGGSPSDAFGRDQNRSDLAAFSRTWCEGLLWIEAECTSMDHCLTIQTTSCDDQNSCTDDECLPQAGCAHQPHDRSCVPADLCASAGVCLQGQCIPGPNDRDLDGDAHLDAACTGGDDCNDQNALVHPGAKEEQGLQASCWDLQDNDCDGQLDDQESACPSRRWRSVGILKDELTLIDTTMLISGDRATFDRDLPENVGVGDVLQYEGNGAKRLAFIHGRWSPSSFLVRDRLGQAPIPCPAGTSVKIFRAYSSLINWQALEENDRIESNLRDFDQDRDLVAAQAIMHVACYDDGPDVTNFDVSGWTTSPAYYIYLMTPRFPFEVGATQRHRGVYGGYRLEPAAAGYTLRIFVPHLRVEGLSIRGWPGGNTTVVVLQSAPDIDFYFLQNIVDSNGNDDNNGTVRIEATSASTAGNVYIANNAIYGTPVAWSECLWLGNNENYSALDYFLFNNSVVNCYRGYEARSTQGHVLAKNNVAVASGSVDFFDNPAGSFNSLSSHNCSSDATSGEIGTNAITGVDPLMVYLSSVRGAEDLHSLPTNPCQALGINLYENPQLAIHEDFDGDTRPQEDPWDMGADQLAP